MIHALDPVYLEAFERLLAQPDPPDMTRRAHERPYGGDPDRRATRLPVILMGWLQRRHLAVDREERLAPARCVQKRAAALVDAGHVDSPDVAERLPHLFDGLHLVERCG